MSTWKTIVPNAIIHDKSLSFNARMLLILLKSFQSTRNPKPFIGIETICELAGWSRRTALKYLAELELARYIDRHQRRTDGRYSTNLYTLNDGPETNSVGRGVRERLAGSSRVGGDLGPSRLMSSPTLPVSSPAQPTNSTERKFCTSAAEPLYKRRRSTKIFKALSKAQMNSLSRIQREQFDALSALASKHGEAATFQKYSRGWFGRVRADWLRVNGLLAFLHERLLDERRPVRSVCAIANDQWGRMMPFGPAAYDYVHANYPHVLQEAA